MYEPVTKPCAYISANTANSWLGGRRGVLSHVRKPCVLPIRPNADEECRRYLMTRSSIRRRSRGIQITVIKSDSDSRSRRVTRHGPVNDVGYTHHGMMAIKPIHLGVELLDRHGERITQFVAHPVVSRDDYALTVCAKPDTAARATTGRI